VIDPSPSFLRPPIAPRVAARRRSLRPLLFALACFGLAFGLQAQGVDAGYEVTAADKIEAPRWQAPLFGIDEAALRSKSSASFIDGFRDLPAAPRGYDSKRGNSPAQSSPAKTQVLAQLAAWGVKPKHVYGALFDGFAARLDREQLEWVRALPEVAYVEFDQIGWLNATNSAPDALWHLDRIDQRALPLDRSFTVANTGAFANIYVVDSGINSTHNDFRDALGRSRVNKLFSIPNQPGEDCIGHGTLVASIVGGWVHGVAKRSNLFDVRVANCQGQISAADVAAALDAIYRDVRANGRERVVVNMSLSFPLPVNFERQMLRLTAEGLVVVTGAGNNGSSGGDLEQAINNSPGRIAAGSSVINVGATTRTDRRAEWSSYGFGVNLLAPGDGLRGASITGADSTQVDSGTSFAAPAVSGTAAVCLTSDASIKPAEMKYRLVNCAHRNVLSTALLNGTNRLLNVGACGCSSGPQFLDMAANHWAYGTVSCLSRLGVGFASDVDRYQPDVAMKRWEMAVFMVQALGEERNIPTTHRSYFTDATPLSWWTPHVERFRELGITAGCGNNRYCPNDNVKRWQMAIFLVNALGEAPTPSHRGYFVDVGANHPQRGQIERLYELG
jgi:hypothetical protein